MKGLGAFLAFVAVATAYEWKSHLGDQILSVVSNTEAKRDFLMHLYDTNKEVEFYDRPARVGRPMEVRVPLSQRDTFTADLAANGIEVTVAIPDYGESLRQSWTSILERQAASANFDYNNFNNFSQIMDEVTNLANQCPEGFTCTEENIGASIEDRELKLLHVSSNKNKPVVWLDATIHAREWLATATMMKLMQQLIVGYGTDTDSTALLNNYDWYLFPVVNPDGYVHTWVDQRAWRKNRRNNVGALCNGVDVNRNFPYLWGVGQPGASDDPCDGDYRGTSPGSEPEATALMDKATAISATENIVGWWSIHTYGNYILLPYGDGSQPSDLADMQRNADAVCVALEQTGGQNWSCGNVVDLLNYAATGITFDWAKAALGVKYSFSPELRGGAFDVPASEIQPSFEEVWQGLIAFVNNFE